MHVSIEVVNGGTKKKMSNGKVVDATLMRNELLKWIKEITQLLPVNFG